MSTHEIVEGFTSALEQGDFETAASYLADDFQFSSDTIPEPLDANQWLWMSHSLREGIPDLSYNFRIEEVDGNFARVSSQLTGTHTNDLDMSGMGIGVIPPTGVSFSADREYSEGEVTADGRIQRIHVYSGPNSGVSSMLAQIGVAPPG